MSTYPFEGIIDITAANDGLARDVVFSDNGVDVWFKDPLTNAPAGTWIKGTLNDGIITVDTPQLVDRTEMNGVTEDWYVQRLKKSSIQDEDGKSYVDWVPDTEKTTISYKYTGDSIIQISEEDIVLGMTNRGKYMFFAENDAVYSKISTTTVKFPEGSTPERWSLLYNNGNYGHQISVVIDGNDFYISGFWIDFPTACIKGTIEGDKVVIPSGQYLGLLRGAQVPRYIYFMATQKQRIDFKQYFFTSDAPMEYTTARLNHSLPYSLHPLCPSFVTVKRQKCSKTTLAQNMKA